MIHDVAVGEEDDAAVGGEEDEDVPDPVQVGEAHTSPVGAEEPVMDQSHLTCLDQSQSSIQVTWLVLTNQSPVLPVVDPGGERHTDDADAPLTQRHNPLVVLEPQL